MIGRGKARCFIQFCVKSVFWGGFGRKLLILEIMQCYYRCKGG